jgi:ABC-2 type transport system permease protein
MHKASLPQLFWLFARTALRRFRNRFTYARQKQREAKRKKKGLPEPVREATAHRNQKLRAGSVLGWLFMAYMAAVFVMMAGMTLTKSARAILDLRQPGAAAAALEKKFAIPQDQAPAGGETRRHYDNDWTVDSLALMNAATRREADLVAALLMALAGAGTLLFSVGILTRQLSRPEPSLAWLFEFPVSRSVLFTSKLCECLFDASLLLLAMLPGVFLFQRGHGFWSAAGWGVAFGFLMALGVAALRIAAEVTLLQKCPRRRRGTIGGLCAAAGTLLLVAVLYGGGTPALLSGLLWLAGALPDWCYWLPFSAGFGAAAPSLPLQWLLAAAISAALCTASVIYCARLTKFGLEPGLESARGATAPPPRTNRRSLPGLVGKEMLMLVRQRTVMVQVLLAPAIMVLMIYFQSSGNFAKQALGSAGALASAIYGICAYMVLIASQVAMNTELRTLWLLLSLPRSLSEALRAKSIIWGTAAAGLGLILAAVAMIALPQMALELLCRLPFLLVLVALIADLCVGIRTMGSSIISETTVHFRQWAQWMPLLLSAFAGMAVHAGDVWMLCVQIVLLGALDVSVWQKLRAELPWLTEPAEDPPPRLYLMHGLLAAFGYFALQGLGLVIAAAVKVPPAAVLPFASGIAAGVVALIAWWQLSLHNVRIFPAGARPPLQKCTLLIPAGMAAACAIGWAWLQLAESIPWMASQLQQSRAVAEAMRASGEWIGLAVLAVVVAPVSEEFIFRGLVYHGLRRTHGFAWSLLWSSLFFTAVHPPLSSVPVFCLAAVNAWIMERTGRLWPCVLVHAGYNGFVLCLQ